MFAIFQKPIPKGKLTISLIKLVNSTPIKLYLKHKAAKSFLNSYRNRESHLDKDSAMC